MRFKLTLSLASEGRVLFALRDIFYSLDYLDALIDSLFVSTVLLSERSLPSFSPKTFLSSSFKSISSWPIVLAFWFFSSVPLSRILSVCKLTADLSNTLFDCCALREFKLKSCKRSTMRVPCLIRSHLVEVNGNFIVWYHLVFKICFIVAINCFKIYITMGSVTLASDATFAKCS